MLIRPYDVRLWQAQGICYEEIGRSETFLSLLIGLVNNIS
jgi:hypothetical protein